MDLARENTNIRKLHGGIPTSLSIIRMINSVEQPLVERVCTVSLGLPRSLTTVVGGWAGGRDVRCS